MATTIPEVVALHARQRPDSPAVITWSAAECSTITYGQLSQHIAATQLWLKDWWPAAQGALLAILANCGFLAWLGPNGHTELDGGKLKTYMRRPSPFRAPQPTMHSTHHPSAVREVRLLRSPPARACVRGRRPLVIQMTALVRVVQGAPVPATRGRRQERTGLPTS